MNLEFGRKDYVSLGIYSTNDVFEAVRKATKGNFDINNKKLKASIGDYKFKANSFRYEVFRESCECTMCGLMGVMFVLERHAMQPDSNPHFNLYGIKENEFILMTKDHIFPKSKGGKDHIYNLQTMCQPCNTEKGSKIC